MTFSLNPYVLAASAAVALGIIIYQLVTHNQERRHAYGGARNRPPSPPPDSPFKPPPPRPPRRRPQKPPEDPEDTSPKVSSASANDENGKRSRNGSVDSVDSSTPYSSISSNESKDSNTESHVRKRNISKSDKEQSDGKKKSSEMENMDKINYEKNVYDKILNDLTRVPMETEEKHKLNKNISNDDSDSENGELQEAKCCNMDVSEQSDPSLDDCSYLSKSADAEEVLYKKQVLAIVESEDLESHETLGASGSSSKVQKEQNEHLRANMEQGICCGCEDAPINTVASPCGHRYLCTDCAKRVMRLHNLCSICLAVIYKFDQSM